MRQPCPIMYCFLRIEPRALRAARGIVELPQRAQLCWLKRTSTTHGRLASQQGAHAAAQQVVSKSNRSYSVLAIPAFMADCCCNCTSRYLVPVHEPVGVLASAKVQYTILHCTVLYGTAGAMKIPGFC